MKTAREATAKLLPGDDMWKRTLIGFILPLGYHSGCMVEKGGRDRKGGFDSISLSCCGSLRLCFLVGFRGCERLESLEDLLVDYGGLEK